MKGTRSSHVLTLLGLLICMMSASCQAKDLTLAANFWEPFTGEELPHNGLASQIVREALQNRGHNVDIVIMPWARIVHKLKNAHSDIDGVVSIWRTEERAEFVHLSVPYYTNQLCLMKQAQSTFNYVALSDLSGKIVGVGRNYDYSDTLKQATHFTRAEAVTTKQNIMRLAKGRIDLVLTDCIIGQYNLQNLQREGVVSDEVGFVGGIIESSPLHFGVPKGSSAGSQIISDFNEGLKHLESSGRLQAIFSLWSLDQAHNKKAGFVNR